MYLFVCDGLFLEKLLVSHLVKKFPDSMALAYNLTLHSVLIHLNAIRFRLECLIWSGAGLYFVIREIRYK